MDTETAVQRGGQHAAHDESRDHDGRGIEPETAAQRLRARPGCPVVPEQDVQWQSGRIDQPGAPQGQRSDDVPGTAGDQQGCRAQQRQHDDACGHRPGPPDPVPTGRGLTPQRPVPGPLEHNRERGDEADDR